MIFSVLVWLFAASIAPWATEYPKAWIVPLKFWISDFMKWLIEDLDFGLFSFKEMTRSVSWLLNWPLTFATALLSKGFSFSSDPGAPVLLQRIPWLVVMLLVASLSWHIKKEPRLTLLVTGCFAYLLIFGRWDSAMITLSSILIAVPLGAAAGLALGIACFRVRLIERVVKPILDLMQTVPIFAYLVPVLFLFGFGPVAAMISTIIYALPPMVRITLLSLQQTPAEMVEYGRMAGCSNRQLLWKVQIPAARRGIMVGVNQVIMLSLNMVIIASMIGAGGLGHDVLTSLRRLDIGKGLEAGIAITLLAIALDRLSQAWADRQLPTHEDGSSGQSKRPMTIFLGIAAAGGVWLLGYFLPWIHHFPEALTITTGDFWDGLVKYININYFDQLELVKNFMLLNVLIPTKRFLLAIPWTCVVTMLGIAGWQIGGRRLAATVTLLALFIAATGQWEKSIITVYLCGISVILATLIGLPIGIWSASSDRAHRVIQAIIDTLQTLPSFVYLIPVVMLFRVGDFAAMLAVVAYALAPAIRYADHGLRQVPEHLIEAGRAMGCSRIQLLLRVRLPTALPEIVLGINQTIMMALSMLVITALVGTRDLGQEVYIALTKADTGRGIVAGLAVAFIAIIADRLINAWAAERKRRLGLIT